MAEVRSQPQKAQVHPTTTRRYDDVATPQHLYYGGATQKRPNESGGGSGGGGGVMSLFPEISLTGTQLLAIFAGVPLGITLLLAAGLSLVGSLIGLAVATPIFLLFSPVLVPAAAAVGLAVAGVLAAGACGLAGLVSLSWVVNYLRQVYGTVPEQYDAAKRLVADMAEYAGEKTKAVGQGIQNTAQETKRTTAY